LLESQAELGHNSPELDESEIVTNDCDGCEDHEGHDHAEKLRVIHFVLVRLNAKRSVDGLANYMRTIS